MLHCQIGIYYQTVKVDAMFWLPIKTQRFRKIKRSNKPVQRNRKSTRQMAASNRGELPNKSAAAIDSAAGSPGCLGQGLHPLHASAQLALGQMARTLGFFGKVSGTIWVGGIGNSVLVFFTEIAVRYLCYTGLITSSTFFFLWYYY